MGNQSEFSRSESMAPNYNTNLAVWNAPDREASKEEGLCQKKKEARPPPQKRRGIWASLCEWLERNPGSPPKWVMGGGVESTINFQHVTTPFQEFPKSRLASEL